MIINARIPPIKDSSQQAIQNAFLKAQYIVIFYYLLVFSSFAIPKLSSWLELSSKIPTNPLWPIGWVLSTDIHIAVTIIFLFLLFGTALAALFPDYRLTRFLAFVGLLFYVALDNSFGKINHDSHIFLLTSFLLIFLPGRWLGKTIYSRVQQKAFLVVIWGCQAIVLLTYSMSGIGKIEGAIRQIADSQINVFSPEAMSLQIANRVLQTNSSTLLGPFLINNMIFNGLIYPTIMLLELFSFGVVFFPRLSRYWALGLIIMHIGIYLSMDIFFWSNIALLVTLFFYSPFSTQSFPFSGRRFDSKI